jgi:hypothetical protein
MLSAAGAGTALAQSAKEAQEDGVGPAIQPARPDEEAPRNSAPEPEELPLPHPLIDVAFELGGQAGGTDLATATSYQGDSETLSAGDGVVIGGSGGVTPLWVSNELGLGLDVSAAVRYWMVGGSGAQAEITAFPLALSVHALWILDAQQFVRFRLGVSRDFAISYFDAPLSGRFDPVAELGFQYMWSDLMGAGISLRYTHESYGVGGAPVSISASGIGVILSLHVCP